VKFYITTAIDYVNSAPHLGTAYEKIAADCIARAHRRLGYDVLFVMGNDEHSTNVEKSAKAAGLDPQAYTDRMEQAFRRAWERLDISFDDFIRTSEPRHHAAVQEIVRRVQARGFIRKDRYTGWYCDGCEAFYTEKDLVDGKCPNHATEPRWVEEENYFFRLSEFRDALLAHIRANPDFIRPVSRRNEIVAFLEGGLEDLSISRSGVRWGIPFPGDPAHVVYVWFDALTNYASAAGFATDDERFARWWPADVHVIGKDITRFHCVIWPAMLLAAGIELPRSVFGHGFIYHSGAKMSKSLGNIVNPLDVVEHTGADPLRFFLLREITFGKDGDFTWESFIARYNADLANDLGNLLKRTTDMTVKFLEGRVTHGGGDATGLRAVVESEVTAATAAYRAFDLSGALDAAWSIVRRANQAIEEQRPWALAKRAEDRGRLANVLSECLEAIRVVAVLAEPAIPSSARKIHEALGLGPTLGLWSESARWRDGASFRVVAGAPLFPRIERAPESTGTSAANGGPAATPAPGPGPGAITIDGFREVDLVVATIVEAHRVEGASRLLRLKLDVGGGTRQVVSGIAEHFEPGALVGRQVVLVANLEPATIRGVESQGMILAAKSGKTLTLLRPDAPVPPGAKIS